MEQPARLNSVQTARRRPDQDLVCRRIGAPIIELLLQRAHWRPMDPGPCLQLQVPPPWPIDLMRVHQNLQGIGHTKCS